MIARGTPPSKPAVELRSLAVDDQGLDAVLKLLRSVWPGHVKMTANYLRWLYRDNPDGHAIGANAWCDGQLVGHYVVVPASVEHAGHVVMAALSLHTAVHPDHRGRGLFTRLAEQTYESCEQAGIDHVFGVANASSTPGFSRRLGFQVIGKLRAQLVLGSPSVVDAADPIWRRFWSDELLAWRLANPAYSYVYREAPGSSLLLRQEPVASLFQPVVMIGISALPQTVSTVSSRSPLLWVGLDERVRFPRWCSLSVPGWARSSPLNLIYRPITSKHSSLNQAEVRLQGLDFDLF